MDIRYSCNQKDFKRYTTEEMRDEMLITGLYKADEVVAVYSHVDRMVTLGCMPVHETVSIDKGIDVWANFGTHYFLERREIGMFNIGKDSTGIVVADGVKYELGYKDCLYITKGTKEVTFASADPEHPAKFYMVSAPAHCSYETRLPSLYLLSHFLIGKGNHFSSEDGSVLSRIHTNNCCNNNQQCRRFYQCNQQCRLSRCRYLGCCTGWKL